MFCTLAKQWNISFHDAPVFSWLEVGGWSQRLWDNFFVQTELKEISYIGNRLCFQVHLKGLIFISACQL